MLRALSAEATAQLGLTPDARRRDDSLLDLLRLRARTSLGGCRPVAIQLQPEQPAIRHARRRLHLLPSAPMTDCPDAPISGWPYPKESVMNSLADTA